MDDKKVNLFDGDHDGDNEALRMAAVEELLGVLNESASRKKFQTRTARPEEQVNHPQHYNFGTIEVIDYIRSTLGDEGCRDFCIGNVIKYISRAKHKGKPVEDLEKAKWYLEYALDIERANAKREK